jgi:hypothetical protein
MRPIARVPNPSRTLMYEENIGRWAWACKRRPVSFSGETTGVDPGPTKAVRGWHGKDWTFNRAMVDGHGETQKVYIAGTEDGDGYAEHFRREAVFDAGPFSGIWLAALTVRGNGWQKDTLPANLIPTVFTSNVAMLGPACEDCVTSEGN